jgi:two-component system cell cycle response regulator
MKGFLNQLWHTLCQAVVGKLGHMAMSGKVLIVDDVSTNRIVFKVKLAAAGYEAILAADGASGLKTAMAERPDLILLDLNLPDMSGIDVMLRLRSNPITRRIPVIMFSAGRDGAARMAALQAGADDFLTKPIDDQTLLARLRSFMRAHSAIASLSDRDAAFGLLGMWEPQGQFERPGVIALVMARPDVALLLRRDLSAQTTDQIVIVGPDQVLQDGRFAKNAAPDVYLIEADMDSSFAGLRIMSELRSRTGSRHAAFCVLNRAQDAASAAIAFDLGANDQVDPSMNVNELALRLKTLLRRKRDDDRLRASVQDGLRLAMIDPLTGLHNRRYGLAQMGVIAERSTQDGMPFAVMVADLDRFKTVNDTWGHAAGDAVLIEVAARLTANLRDADLVARIGGEEFLIALPHTEIDDARQVADRLCHAIESQPIVLENGATLPVTISIGLALSTDPGATNAADRVSYLVNAADQALLASKSAGRNTVTTSRNAA